MITSVHNPKVQEVRQLLRQVKARRERGEFVLEGVRLAEEALDSGWDASLVLFASHLDPRGVQVVEKFSGRGVPAEMVSDELMHSLSDTETPQGLVVVMRQHTLPVPPSPDFLLILDGIRDPGNLGTILRTAAAAGVQSVLLSTDCVDEVSPKVVRSGMGAHFHLPIARLDWNEIASRLRAMPSMHYFLADASSGIPYTSADFRTPIGLVLGGEAAGASQEARSITEQKVRIPMPGGSESLNVAIATGILLFEVVRQRSSAGR
jgi:TrmH family RNA methyltransferase